LVDALIPARDSGKMASASQIDPNRPHSRLAASLRQLRDQRDNVFQGMMHPSLRGYIARAQAVLQALKARGAFDWPQDVPAPVIDPALCVAHFGLGKATRQHFCYWQRGLDIRAMSRFLALLAR
jgi:hypothetical protein